MNTPHAHTPATPHGRRDAALQRRAESAASFVVALVVALLAAAALLHWATPCALPDSLCLHTTTGAAHHG